MKSGDKFVFRQFLFVYAKAYVCMQSVKMFVLNEAMQEGRRRKKEDGW